MEPTERDLFKAIREGLGRNQTEVGQRGGVKQSTISKIEIEPAYQPSVIVFRRALKGIDETFVSFYQRLDGVTPTERPQVADHESLPPLASFEGIAAAAIRRLTERIVTLENRIDRQRKNSRLPQANDRHAATTRAEAAERPHADRGRRPNHAAVQRRRPPKK